MGLMMPGPLYHNGPIVWACQALLFGNHVVVLPRFDAEGCWVDAPTPWQQPIDESFETCETRAMVRKAIDRLPESYRTVLLLRDIEELDTDEAATILQVSANAVKTRLHRARQALRTLLERALLGEDQAARPTARAGSEV